MLRPAFAAGSVAVLLLAAVLPASAWDVTGHRVVGQIAENHLTPQAAQAVRELLGFDSLAEVSNWADEVRSADPWRHTTAWHYVNFAAEEQEYETTKKNPAGDAVTAMRWCEAALRNPAGAREEKIAALRFLVHFVGDIHQPLHAGLAEDRGGNLIEVYWMFEKEPTNLHRVWDSDIVEWENLSFTEWTRFLDHTSEGEVRDWQASDYADWANESRGLSERCYEFDKGQPLGYPYFTAHLRVVKQRLLQAGVRLAGKLNSVFGDGAAR
jgi:hypothetical protein